MAQIRIAGLEAKPSKKRERLRERVFGETAAEKRTLARLTKRKLGRRLNIVEREKRSSIKGRARERSKSIRRKIARALEQEERRRAFKQLGVTRKKEKRRIVRRIDDEKVRLIRELDPSMTEAQARVKAKTAQLQFRAEAATRAAKFRGFVRVKGRWFRATRKIVKGVPRVTRKGPAVKASTVNRSVAASAYWKRVKSLARAFDIPVNQARKLDRRMLEVPEATRVRIYEKFKRRA